MSLRLIHGPANVRAAAARSEPPTGASEGDRTVSPRDGDHHGPSLVLTRGQGTGRDQVGTECLIGRAGGADVVVEDPSVSRRHARVVFQDGMYLLYDLGSRNGTFVNGRPVKVVVLDDRDVIRLGRAELVFCWEASAAGTTSAPVSAEESPAGATVTPLRPPVRPHDAAWASGPAVRSGSSWGARSRAVHPRRRFRP